MAIAVRALFMGGSPVLGFGDWLAGRDTQMLAFRGVDVENPASLSTGGVRMFATSAW